MKVEFNYDLKKKEVKIVTDYFSNIRERFSVKNPAARYNRFGKFIPQRIYAITSAGYCGLGLVPEIINYLRAQNIPFDIKFDSALENIFKRLPFQVPTGYPNIKELNSEYPLRDYQRDALIKALTHGHGVIELATGGGKTLIIANLVYAGLQLLEQKERILIVVPDLGLVQQTYKDFISYNFPMGYVTKWTGACEIDLTAKVIIANLGILQSEKSDLSWFEEIGMLIVDECHKLRHGNKVNKLIDRTSSFRRFGFTGTLPESDIDKWSIFSSLGSVIFKKTTTELREKVGDKYIANAQALSVRITYDRVPDYTSVTAAQRYLFELDFIHNSEYRNNAIKKIANNLTRNCLVLVDHIAHGDNLFNALSNLKDKQVYFIQGSVEIEDRQKIQQIMETQNNIICIAISKIFSTGISIKNIHYIMFAAGGKSKIKVLQSIGRGLRTHAEKNTLVLIDIVDDLIYGKSHYEKRKKFYDLEKIKITEKTITET